MFAGFRRVLMGPQSKVEHLPDDERIRQLVIAGKSKRKPQINTM
jgi:hypothetical protein